MTTVAVNDWIRSYWQTQAIGVVAELGIADRLVDGPMDVEALAAACDVAPDPLYRVLRALASIGIFREEPPRAFGLTPMAAELRTDRPSGQAAFALFHFREFYAAWTGLLDAVRTGRPAFQTVFGQSLFDYLVDNPDRGAVFDRAMRGAHDRETVPVLDACDWAGFNSVVDVGGGNGSVVAAMTARFPGIDATLFDLPEVVRRASVELQAAAVACHIVGGSFFDSVPPGADAYLLRHIVHDWDDADAVRILERCREAAHQAGRVLVVETVIPSGNTPFLGKWRDLSMLVIGGRERTAEEYVELFRKAGLRLTRIVPTQVDVSIVEGVPM